METRKPASYGPRTRAVRRPRPRGRNDRVGRHVLDRASPRAGGAGHPDRSRLGDPDRAVLLLHRRHHVADPRRLHGVRGGRLETQEHHVDGDEEHPHHRRRHADVLLLRLVHLRLLPGGLAEGRARRARPSRARLLAGSARTPRRGRRRWGRTSGPRQRSLLPRLPPLLLDDGVDHVRGPDRARPAVGVPHPRLDPRLGRLDHGRRLGLELGRLARHALRLPRLDRVARRARRRRSVHARRAPQSRAANREVHGGRHRAELPRPQRASDAHGADADLHRASTASTPPAS